MIPTLGLLLCGVSAAALMGEGSPAPIGLDFFDGDFTTQPYAANSVWPCATYDATSNKTYHVWLAEGSPQIVRVAAFDHSSGLWSRAVTVSTPGLNNDTHGNPAIVVDHEGYLHVFWGSHVGSQQWATSAAPRNIESWIKNAAISGSYTYPKPVVIGSDLLLFMRSGSTSDSSFIVRKLSPSGGAGTFAAEVNLIDWTPANVGIYVTEVRYNGTEIEFMACQQTGTSPQVRRHLFYFAWNPVTGALRNLDGSVTIAAGSLPLLHAQSLTDFRIVDTGSNITELPSWCRDSAGNLHVVYFNGSANPFPLFHRVWDGSSWSADVQVASMNGRGNPRIRYLCLVPAGSMVELWYPDGDVGGWTAVGGDYMARRVWTAGTWAAEEVILTGDGSSALGNPSAVHNAHSDARVVFGESAQTELYNDRFLAKRYVYGDSGFTKWPLPVDEWESRVIEKVIYSGANGSKPTDLDKSWVADPISWSGHAVLQGDRLALDGTGDYTSLGITAAVNNRRYYMNGTANKNSGEFCIDLRRIKFTNTTQTACVWGRGGTSGNRSLFAYYRGELTPDQFSFEYSFDGTTLNNLRFDFSPDTSKEYDFRISRDTSGKLRIHHAESGSDLVMVASATIGTGEFYPTTRRVNHGAYNEGSNTMNGSIGGTRVTLSDRGTTDANVAAADMAFDA